MSRAKISAGALQWREYYSEHVSLNHREFIDRLENEFPLDKELMKEIKVEFDKMDYWKFRPKIVAAIYKVLRERRPDLRLEDVANRAGVDAPEIIAAAKTSEAWIPDTRSPLDVYEQKVEDGVYQDKIQEFKHQLDSYPDHEVSTRAPHTIAAVITWNMYPDDLKRVANEYDVTTEAMRNVRRKMGWL